MPGPTQPPWTPQHKTVPMDYVDGDTKDVLRGYHYELLAECRKHNIHRKSVTPYTSRFGYGFVIQNGEFHDTNHVTLWTKSGYYQRFPLKAGAAQYRTLMHLTKYSRLMEAIEDDYPLGSLTAELAATLAQILQLWATAKDDRNNSLDLRPVDEIVAARLNPFAKAWLDPIPQDDD
ncbi:hypothetical protein OG339_48560 (plasmid) [Streptosporangium sp. NBC_01495]|uniref:hypothetical protein n=1 Tax=Streptosporangium sp. NBC_01495 TaxID=2903899 RepID=UPI002E301E3F|nr:hypothetical protein [Streptosporangium sp. NBC_01495]